MVRFEKLVVPDKVYLYVDALAAADYINGIFGTISDGTFTAGAGDYCIMQVEDGDNAYSTKYEVLADSHVRVADMTQGEGYIINITADELPDSYEAGNVLAAGSDGTLEVSDGTTGYTIIEVTDYGCRAEVTLA